MGSATRVLSRGLRMVWEELFTLIIVAALWTLVALGPPLVAGGLGGWLAALVVLLVSLPPATAGAYYVTNRLAHDRVGSAGHFIEGMRRYAVPSWILAVLDVVVLVIVILNLRFYGAMDAMWVPLAIALWLAVLFVWFIVQLFVFPILMEQQEAKIPLALRNSLLISFGSPFHTLPVVVLIALVVGLLLVLAPNLPGVIPLFLLVPPLVALLTNVAVVERLKQLRGEPDLDAEE